MMPRPTRTGFAHTPAPHLSKVHSRHAGECLHLICFIFKALQIGGGLTLPFPPSLDACFGILGGWCRVCTIGILYEAGSAGVQVKLLAEPWDCGGLYQVGSFPNWDVWGEWNGRFRDDVRRFVKGDQGMKAAFATRLAGSADLYNVNKRCPAAFLMMCHALLAGTSL